MILLIGRAALHEAYSGSSRHTNTETHAHIQQLETNCKGLLFLYPDYMKPLHPIPSLRTLMSFLWRGLQTSELTVSPRFDSYLMSCCTSCERHRCECGGWLLAFMWFQVVFFTEMLCSESSGEIKWCTFTQLSYLNKNVGVLALYYFHLMQLYISTPIHFGS